MTAKETAREAYVRNQVLFVNQIARLLHHVNSGKLVDDCKNADWGHVGSLAEVNELLKRANDFLGVAK